MFSLSLRDVELLLAERGVVVSYETVRRWCKKFGASFADRLRRRRPPPGDKWHMDEVFIWIQGVQHYLWRAVDQNGVVLDILVQARHDADAAKRFFKRLLKGLQYVPRERLWTHVRRLVSGADRHERNDLMFTRTSGQKASAADISTKWGWFVALGIAMIALGVAAWLDVITVTIASSIFVGASLLIGGVLQITMPS